MTRQRQGELFVIFLCLIESWFPILSLFSIALVGALYSYALVIVVATVALLILLALRGEVSQLFIPTAQKDMLLTSLFITLLFLLIFLGLRYTTAGNMAVIIFLQLLFSYLYFNVFGSERLTRRHSWGAFFMGIGAIIILFPDDFNLNKGDLLIFIAAAIAPIANLYQKRARTHVSSMTLLTYRNLIALPFLLLIAYTMEPMPELENVTLALPYIAAIGLLVYVGAKILWVEALHRISITKMSAMIAIMPLFTLLFAYLVLHEVPGMRHMFGILPILIGGWLITRPDPTSSS